MKTLSNIAIILAVSSTLVGCFNKNKPNYQYFPDMYVSPSYETYGAYEIFPGEQSALLPVKNTIPRGYEPYELEDSFEGYDQSKDILDYPFEVTEENLAVGAHLYTLYCAVCHGDKGDGKGILVEREKLLGIPSYADPGRVIVPGRIYHVETYGLNTMGSYASQVNSKERWQIAMHVMDLKANLLGEPGVLAAAKKDKENKETTEVEEANAETADESQSN